MRNKILIFIFILTTNIIVSQEIIDLNNKIKTSTLILNKGKHTLKITPLSKIETIEIDGRSLDTKPLSAMVNKSLKDSLANFSEIKDDYKTFDFDFKDNTIYTFTIKIVNDTTSRKYVFKSISKRSWSTTFGANSIFLTNPNSYKTIKSGTDVYIVTEYSGEKRIEYIPSLMFTFMDKSKDISFGYSGGIGFDLKQISVFSGISLGIGQNIILTGGIAFHQQEKLNSTYTLGQEVDTALTTENLTTMQYRFNPFVGISFRLDNNPFK